MSVELSTAPTQEFVTLEDARDHLRITGTTQDVAIQRYLRAARARLQDDTGRSLMTQTLKLRRDNFPETEILLPYPPVQSVTSIKYTDPDGVEQTWSTDEWDVDIYALMPRIRPAYGYSWPSIRVGMNAVLVEYVAGFGAAPGDLPGDFIDAGLCLLADLWGNRATGTDGPPVREIKGAGASYRAFLAGISLYDWEGDCDEEDPV